MIAPILSCVVYELHMSVKLVDRIDMSANHNKTGNTNQTTSGRLGGFVTLDIGADEYDNNTSGMHSDS